MAAVTHARNGLRRKVSAVIRKQFPGARLSLDPPEGRLTGLMVWKGFVGVEQIDRQNRLWKALRSNLSRDEQNQIAAILTMTPLER